jgi:transposase
MNSLTYLDILKNSFLKIHEMDNELIYQDDNDPKHRAKIITKWKNKKNIQSLEWPSNSPDLNPIENIWGLLKNKIQKINVMTVGEFIKCIQNKWKEIDNEIIINIINSMPSRIQQVIENNGDSIDY